MRNLIVVVSVLALSCGGGGPPAPSSAPAPELPMLEGRAVLDVPIAAAPPAVQRAWETAQAMLADRRPAFPEMKPWMERQVERLTTVKGALEGGEAPLFAAILLGVLAEDLVEQLVAMPPPPDVAADPETARVFREILEEQSVPIATLARDAYATCATRAPAAAEVLRAWATPCAEARDALAARIERVQAVAAARPKLPEGPAWPPECKAYEHWDDPQAPAPDASAPLAIAVVDLGDRFRGKDRETLLAAVEARLAARVETPLVPRAEVARAEQLVARKRWTPKGPACGQAPPLPALLAAKRPHLALASVSTSCDAETGACHLSVWTYRPGSDDERGLPPAMFASVTGDPAKLDSWLDAATRLGDEQPPGGGVFASLSMLGSEVRVLGQTDDDPWLRIGPTLGDARDALLACVGDGAVASVTARWRISRSGAISGVAVTPATAADDVARCVAAALEQTAWPCPRAGKPVDVDVTICLAKPAR